jgi:hypothetical protein
MRCAGLTAFAIVCLATAATARPAKPPILDPPLRTQHVDLGPSQYTPGQHSELRCYTYTGFVVKEIDEREVGDEQISIVQHAAGTAPPRCERANAAGAHVISADQWSGYVLGAKAGFVFLRGADGANGGVDLGVYRAADGAKVFQDTMRDSTGPALRSIAIDGSVLRLRYARVVTAQCSMPHDGAACWAHVSAEQHLPAGQPPDCAAGYRRAKQALAAGRCEAQSQRGNTACLHAELQKLSDWDSAPSVVGYDVEAEVTPSGSTIHPAGGPVACWPSD